MGQYLCCFHNDQKQQDQIQSNITYQKNKQNNESNNQRNKNIIQQQIQAIQRNSELSRNQCDYKNDSNTQMPKNNLNTQMLKNNLNTQMQKNDQNTQSPKNVLQLINNHSVQEQNHQITNQNDTNKNYKELFNQFDKKPNGIEDQQNKFNNKEYNSYSSKDQQNLKLEKENDRQIKERYNYSNQDKNNHQIENSKEQINSNYQNENSNKNLSILCQNRYSIQGYNLNRIKQDQTFQDKNREIQTYYGIQNLGNTCYINSALQMLRQIYEENEQFLDQRSDFAQNLKEFFQGLSKGYVNRQLLNEFISISNEKQTHLQNGGDSYVTAFNYLSIIINETNKYKQNNINEYNLTQFQQIFTIIFQDGLFCENCKRYLMDSTDFPYFNEPDSSLDFPKFPEYSIESVYEGIQAEQCYCNKCFQKSNLKTLRTIAFFPQFLIVKLTKSSYKLGDKKESIQYDEISYQLIGYCNYDGAHYTYTAKKNNTWITYNDSRTYQVYLNLSYSIYQLYKRM